MRNSVPTTREQEAARVVAALLEECPVEDASVTVRVQGGGDVALPVSLVEVVRSAAQSVADGLPVAVLAADEMLTTQEAADLLGVSRPTIVSYLTSGEIPYTAVGSHRRVRAHDLAHYQRDRRDRRREGLRKLTDQTEFLGLYSQ